MAISLYDVSVANSCRPSAPSAYLDAASSLSDENGLDPETIVETRLARDMLPFRSRSSRSPTFPRRHRRRQSGEFRRPVRRLRLAGLQGLVAETRER